MEHIHSSLEQQIQDLERQKQEAINRENYEAAASLRDKILRLQGNEIPSQTVETLADRVVESSQKTDIEAVKKQQEQDLKKAYVFFLDYNPITEQYFGHDNTFSEGALSPEKLKKRKEGVEFAEEEFSRATN
jgi:hypothetical protein